MTPATEALVERLSQAEQVQRWAHNDPMVSLLVEAQVEIRALPSGEQEVAFEVWDGDDLMAASSDEKEARRYAALYAQDGPVKLLRAVTYRSEVAPDHIGDANQMVSPPPAGEG